MYCTFCLVELFEFIQNRPFLSDSYKHHYNNSNMNILFIDVTGSIGRTAATRETWITFLISCVWRTATVHWLKTWWILASRAKGLKKRKNNNFLQSDYKVHCLTVDNEKCPDLTLVKRWMWFYTLLSFAAVTANSNDYFMHLKLNTFSQTAAVSSCRVWDLYCWDYKCVQTRRQCH